MVLKNRHLPIYTLALVATSLFSSTANAGRPIEGSFKVLGRGIVDESTGDILQIACVGEDGDPVPNADCSNARFATSNKSGQTYFHGSPEDPLQKVVSGSQAGANNWRVEIFPFSERLFVNMKAIQKADAFQKEKFTDEQPYRKLHRFLRFSKALSAGDALEVRDRENWQFKQEKISHELYTDILRSSLLDDDGVSSSSSRPCAYKTLLLKDSETDKEAEDWRHLPILRRYESQAGNSNLFNMISDNTGRFLKNYITDHSRVPNVQTKYTKDADGKDRSGIGGYFFDPKHTKKVMQPTVYGWYSMRNEIMINTMLRKNMRMTPHDDTALEISVSKISEYASTIDPATGEYRRRPNSAGGCLIFEFKDKNQKTWSKESCWNGGSGFQSFMNKLPTCAEIGEAGLAL